MPLQVTNFRRTNTFDKDVRAAPPDVQTAATQALRDMKACSAAGALRLHSLKGYPKPTIYKIDVFPNRSWQITFELDGSTAVLLRLGTHKQIDRIPRAKADER